MEKLSLYIPCYNAEKYIGECLDGVIKQTYPIDEILIINDGSNDKTVSIASAYPVRIIHHNKNKGLAAARNTAFKEAKNDYVAALDADCVPRPDWLEHLIKNFSDNTIAGAGGMLVEKYIVNGADKWRVVHMSQHWGNYIIKDPPFLYGCNTIFKKTAIETIGLYNNFYRNNYEDVDISKRLFENNYTLLYDPKAAVDHLRKDTVISVLTAFSNWDYSTYIHPPLIDKISRRIAIHIGKLAYITEKVGQFCREDFQNKRYKIIFITIMLLFYYPFLNFKYLIEHDTMDTKR